MRVLSQSETSTATTYFMTVAPSANSWESEVVNPLDIGILTRSALSRGVVAVAFVLGASPTVTRVLPQSEGSSAYYTTYEERHLWTWRDVYRLAMSIVEKAEAKRLALAKAEARFYSESDATEG